MRMRAGCLLWWLAVGLCAGPVGGVRGQGEAPAVRAPMKFGEVREVAPGVFFRYSAISATDKNVVFGGCNNIWVVFDDYVLVYDANFPKEAGDVIAAIRKTTGKPIRYVLDSHHHGDHAYGNAVFAKQGATVVAQANCARLLRIDGPKEFAEAGKGKTGRKDVAESFLKVPDLIFDQKLVFDDGHQRAELYFFGHAHTAGDAFMYLPKAKVLCTGDACTNGAFNYMGHSDSPSWIRVLDQAMQLDVATVCPGHGPLGGPDVLRKQRRFFVELREQVRRGVDQGLDVDDVARTIDMPWHKEWTGIEARDRKEEITHVFGEFTGKVVAWELIEDFGVYEGPSPTKQTPGWTRPKRIVVPALMKGRLLELKRIAPDVLFVPVRDAEEAAREAAAADAVVGFCTADIVHAGKGLRWIQVGHAGVEKDVPALAGSHVVLTNTARIYGSNVADQAMALLLAHTRGLARQIRAEVYSQTGASILDQKPGIPKTFRDDIARSWEAAKKVARPDELHGQTMLVVGLGGVGMQVAARAHAFGMRVMAIDPNEKIVRPATVFSLERPDKLTERLPQADVVVLCCPLTKQTRGMFGKAQFAAMKPTAVFINVARGGLVETDALVGALRSERIAGAGLDVTDPEPLPPDHPLWLLPNVVISPHVGGQSPAARDRQWRLFRENIRRFVAGEPLLCVVDQGKGY